MSYIVMYGMRGVCVRAMHDMHVVYVMHVMYVMCVMHAMRVMYASYVICSMCDISVAMFHHGALAV